MASPYALCQGKCWVVICISHGKHGTSPWLKDGIDKTAMLTLHAWYAADDTNADGGCNGPSEGLPHLQLQASSGADLQAPKP